MKRAFLLLLPFCLAACSAPPTKQELALRSDFAECLSRGKETVPDYLYPMPHYVQETLPDDHGVLHDYNVLKEPDFAVVEPLDKERMGIIKPCMKEKGWSNKQTQDEWDRVRLLTH